MKDVPSEMPAGMMLAAMLPRADPRDAFVSLRHKTFADLPQGARVGTSSLRRQCQLKFARPDLQLVTLRGNVDTRLRKLEEEGFDAIILAAAGLIRLGLESRITQYFDYEQSVPAVGQGIIGIECRSDDAINIGYVSALNDIEAWQCCAAERAFAQRLEGSCQSPIAGFATLAGERLQLHAVIGSPDGSEVYRGSSSGAIAEAQSIGVRLAETLLQDGAAQLLERLRQEPL
jgi:hydroxymethylbilane synthase